MPCLLLGKATMRIPSKALVAVTTLLLVLSEAGAAD